MTQFYYEPSRESDPYALPDAEVFYYNGDGSLDNPDSDDTAQAGYYYWPCFPGCLPDSDPIGPFDSEEQAIEDARDTLGFDED